MDKDKNRLAELQMICAPLSAEVQAVITPVLYDIVYEEEMLAKFRANPKTKTNAAMNKAYRQIKQLYQADVKLLLWQLRQNETSAADALLSVLSEYE